MNKSPDLVVYDHYKALSSKEKGNVIDTLVSEGIMSRPSLFHKIRNRSFTVLEARYVAQLIKSIVDAREN